MSQLLTAIHSAFNALEQVARAARLDDKTPLLNSTALSELSSTVGDDPSNPQAVVFADLNRFKQINDQHGHEAGDLALKVEAADLDLSSVGDDQKKSIYSAAVRITAMDQVVVDSERLFLTRLRDSLGIDDATAGALHADLGVDDD